MEKPMSNKNTTFTPKWYEERVPDGTFRSIFKWGDPNEFKHPNKGLYKLMKQSFNLTDDDFMNHRDLCLDPVEDNMPPKMERVHLDALTAIVGEENIRQDVYTRIRASYGKGMIDALRLRKKIIENIADIVIYPRDKEDLKQIIAFCNEHLIPIYIFGGGSTVTRGMEAVKGGVSLDMSVHMNKVISFNETDQTITVQAGMSGPQLEEYLNKAPKYFNATQAYTLGHFPQSFEYSSVGGWVVTRGAGQNSTYYGKIEDMVIAQEYITPVGTIKTTPYPRKATGPDIDQLMIGNEGTFGILANVTLKLHKLMPENQKRFSYMFKNWDDAINASREIMQGEFGLPSVFRMSDPEETDVGMRLYGIEDTPASSVLNMLGFKPMQKCLLLGMTDGDITYSKNVNRRIRQICRKYGAFNLSAFGVTKKWEHGRFRDPYLREDLQDYGIMTDTLECAVTWSQMKDVHAKVRAIVKQRPETICMTHLSHAYPQGGNLYFIFIARIDRIPEYLDLQYSILEAIQQNGAAMSHHHGLGKQTAPWLEEQIGTPCMDIFRTLKKHFDPNFILNPGGTLGFDMSEEQKKKIWSKDLEA
jgi:alkyldihydroxyacetonephosphate synthase